MSPTDKPLFVNEVFYSLQGEGKRAGDPSIFVRMAGCNMQCDDAPGPKSPGGFKCDTEFESSVKMTLDELRVAIAQAIEIGGAKLPMTADSNPFWIVFTGGEPALQVTRSVCDYFHALGYKLAIETNGSICLPLKDTIELPETLKQIHDGVMIPRGPSLETVLSFFTFDWITVSPKVAEHAIEQCYAHEVKYVRGAGQGLPKTRIHALNKLLSPAFNGLVPDRLAIATCVELARKNPEWSMSVQLHKSWMIR